MSDDRDASTPEIVDQTTKRKRAGSSSTSPLRNKRQKRHHSQSIGPGRRSRSRSNISRDRKGTRKYRRHRSRTEHHRGTRRVGRSRSRSGHRRRSRRTRVRTRRTSTSTSCSTRCSERDSTSSSTASSSTSSDGTHSSRSSTKHPKTKRNRKRSPRSGSNRDKDHTVMDKLIDALGKHGRNTYVGAHDVISTFDPSQKMQSTKAWLRKVNETAEIYKWSDKQTVFHALPKLAGLARTWYESLPSVNLKWKEWQRKLLQTFPDNCNYADKLSEMLARRSRREETLEEYFYDKAKLVSRCNIKGKDAVDCIIHGIFDTNIKLNAQGANFKSPNKLLRYLRNITMKYQKEVKRTPAPSKIPAVTRNNDMSKNNNFNNATRICYNCSEPGHTAPRCRKEPQKCTKCNRIGHVADHCKREPNTDINKTVSTDEVSSQSTKVLLITAKRDSEYIYNKEIKVNGKSKTGFVDFGSQCTLIKHSIVKELNLQIQDDNLPLIKGFADGTMRPLGRVSVYINLDFIEARIEAYVVPDQYLSTDLLIGQNVTEMSEVVVYKTSSSLTLYSSNPKNNRTPIYNSNNVVVKDILSVAVTCEDGYTGWICTHGNTSFKPNEELVILPGVYFFKDGLGCIPIISFSGKEIVLKKNRLLARGCRLPTQTSAPMELPNEFEVRRMTLSDPSTAKVTKTPISLEMLNIGDDVTQEQKQALLDLLNEFRDCFSFDMSELGTTNISEMHIQLQDNSPVAYKPYRLSYSEREVVRDMVNELLENKIIQESDSSYASPIVLVKKKNNEYRLCVDYRALNKKTVKDSYPMPVIDDQLDRLSGKVYFTSLDLKSGYYQIPMAEDSRHLTAFVTPDGHYEYARMPFGLVNAPAIFQHMINKALGKDRYDLAIPYMDDLLSPASSVDEGMLKLRKILSSLLSAGLTLNITKCYFFKKNLDYLGYEVSADGLRPGSKKIEAVASFPKPTNVHQVRQFVGLASFFRRFIPGFATIAKPLTVLTRSDVTWRWDQEQDSAFQTLKEKLVERPVLALYNPKYLTEVHCDASKLGVGGILLQRPDERSPLKAVAYYSKQTAKEEEYLHSYELETLAVVLSLRKFRTYLIGIPFKVYTDCNALRTTLTKRDLVPRIARWWLHLQEYDFSVEYRPGDNMRHVDALSRNPIPNTSNEDQIDTREFEVMSISTTEWLQTVQMTDMRLKFIKSILDSGRKDIQDIIDNYVIKDNKIYRKIGEDLKWVVPDGARWRVCQICHDEAGHFSIDKTLDKMKQDYWFPRMNRFVRKYVAACLNCAFNKTSTSKASGYLHPIPKGDVPFHTLHMDHLGPFVRSRNGNTYILGIIDGFSKFIFIKPVKNVKSKTTIKILEDLFSVIGSPKVIISDRGTSFTSTTFKKYIQTIGTKHVLNAVATPRANGQIERYNRTILESLAASNHGMDEREWDSHVQKVQWSLNNTLNKSTGMSPSDVVFGRRTTNPSEGPILNAIQDITDSTCNVDISTQGLETARDEIRDKAVDNITNNQMAMKTHYDNHRAPTKIFQLGDLVMIPNHHLPATGKSKKLLPKFRGPFKISAVLKNDRYEISSIEGHTKRKYKSIYSADALKKWITFTTPDDNVLENDPSSSDSSS